MDVFSAIADVRRPLKLYGQELTGSSYAIARVNMAIHDMEGEIVRGNSMTNPKFRETDASLKKTEGSKKQRGRVFIPDTIKIERLVKSPKTDGKVKSSRCKARED